MNALILIIAMFAAAVCLLTSLAKLADENDAVERIVNAYMQAKAQWLARQAGGPIDWVALADAFRPILAVSVKLVILASSGAVLFTSFMPTMRQLPWVYLLLVGLTAQYAMQVPCSWLRYVFIGDRRKPESAKNQPYTGPERRRHG